MSIQYSNKEKEHGRSHTGNQNNSYHYFEQFTVFSAPVLTSPEMARFKFSKKFKKPTTPNSRILYKGILNVLNVDGEGGVNRIRPSDRQTKAVL